ncbi:hypothetical protein [Salinisphaera sp. G21_0]|uniref:hypothetical protein n=1 Tax=Salinisphaera sp. G21_0 TaxID=2821094 RepID=UPI001ADC9136|nr:hypothetical protein [Salinisphaera sp. G21_0]MBO9482275.1 hypothetical protein [Salinisphaera sp. G21_0]
MESVFTEFVTFGRAEKLTGIETDELEQLAIEGKIGVYFRLNENDRVDFYKAPTVNNVTGETECELLPLSFLQDYAQPGYKQLFRENVAAILRHGQTVIHRFQEMPADVVVGHYTDNRNEYQELTVMASWLRLNRSEVLNLVQPANQSADISDIQRDPEQLLRAFLECENEYLSAKFRTAIEVWLELVDKGTGKATPKNAALKILESQYKGQFPDLGSRKQIAMLINWHTEGGSVPFPPLIERKNKK